MTTNNPEQLDKALIRPGRVDLQVPFSNASQQQIEELFIRMYASPQEKTVDEKGTVEEDIESLAKEFAKKVPGGKFSPAVIQGFLLMRKREPRRAVEEVGALVGGEEGKGEEKWDVDVV